MNVRFQKPKNPWKPFCCSNQNPLKHTEKNIFTTTTVMLPCHTNTIWAPLARCDQPRGWRECHFGCLTSSEPTPHWISPALAQVFLGKSWLFHGYFIWLVVYLPLWKIWMSVGIIIPSIWKNYPFMFQTTNQSWLCHSYSMGFCWDLIFLCIWWRSYGDCTTFNGRGWFIHLGFVVLLLFFVNVTQSNDWYVHHGSYGWLYAYKKFESSNLPIAGHRIVYLPHLLAEIQ